MKFATVTIFMVSVGLLAGCGGGDHKDIKLWMDEVSQDLRGKVPALPELRPFPVVSYDAIDTQDPFNAGRVNPEVKDTGTNKPDFNRPRELLESYPLESLDFIGVLTKNQSGARYALIQVDGVVHQAGRGNYLGQNFGHIVEIMDNEILLVETVQDPSGQSTEWVERDMTLQLQEGLQGKEKAK